MENISSIFVISAIVLAGVASVFGFVLIVYGNKRDIKETKDDLNNHKIVVKEYIMKQDNINKDTSYSLINLNQNNIKNNLTFDQIKRDLAELKECMPKLETNILNAISKVSK